MYLAGDKAADGEGVPRAAALGVSYRIDLEGCDPAALDDEMAMARLAEAVAAVIGANVVEVHTQKFSPVGVSVVALLSLSHLAIHTWPLNSDGRSLAIDLFSCDASASLDEGAAARVILPACGGRVVSFDRRSRFPRDKQK